MGIDLVNIIGSIMSKYLFLLTILGVSYFGISKEILANDSPNPNAMTDRTNITSFWVKNSPYLEFFVLNKVFNIPKNLFLAISIYSPNAEYKCKRYII